MASLLLKPGYEEKVWKELDWYACKDKKSVDKNTNKTKMYKDLIVNKIYEIYILWKPFNIMTAPETIRYIIDRLNPLICDLVRR